MIRRLICFLFHRDSFVRLSTDIRPVLVCRRCFRYWAEWRRDA